MKDLKNNSSLMWGASWAATQIVMIFIIKTLRGLIIPFILAPQSYALWATIGVLLGYLRYADLGVHASLAKRLPVFLANDDRDSYQKMIGLGLSWNLVIGMLLTIGLVAASFLYKGENQHFYQPALLILAVTIVFQNIRTLCNEIIRSRCDYKGVSMQSIIGDVASFIAAVVGVIFFGELGLVASILVGEVFGLGYCIIRLIDLGFDDIRLYLQGLTSVIREGLLLLLVGFIEMIMMTLDQIFLINFYDNSEYGLYAFGLFIVSMLIAMSMIFVTHQPYILRLADLGRKKECASLLEANLVLYLTIIAICTPLMFFAIDLLLNYYLKEYQPGLMLYILMPIIALARAPVVILRGYFIAYHQEKNLIRWQLSGLMLMLILNFLIIDWSLSYEWFIASICAGYGLTGGLMFRKFCADNSQIGNYYRYMIYIILLVLGSYGIHQLNNIYLQLELTEFISSLLIFFIETILFIGLVFWKKGLWMSSLALFLDGTKSSKLRFLHAFVERNL